MRSDYQCNSVESARFRRGWFTTTWVSTLIKKDLQEIIRRDLIHKDWPVIWSARCAQDPPKFCSAHGRPTCYAATTWHHMLLRRCPMSHEIVQWRDARNQSSTSGCHNWTYNLISNCIHLHQLLLIISTESIHLLFDLVSKFLAE